MLLPWCSVDSGNTFTKTSTLGITAKFTVCFFTNGKFISRESLSPVPPASTRHRVKHDRYAIINSRHLSTLSTVPYTRAIQAGQVLNLLIPRTRKPTKEPARTVYTQLLGRHDTQKTTSILHHNQATYNKLQQPLPSNMHPKPNKTFRPSPLPPPKHHRRQPEQKPAPEQPPASIQMSNCRSESDQQHALGHAASLL